MNDGLRDAILEAVVLAHHPEWPNAPTYMGQLTDKCARCNSAAEAASESVRAWLALPPSEDEIEAAAKAMWANDRTWADIDPTNHAINVSLAKAALVASRAVLVRPPEVEKEPS